jgi:hypothetical protein
MVSSQSYFCNYVGRTSKHRAGFHPSYLLELVQSVYSDTVLFTPASSSPALIPQRSIQGSELFTLDLPVSITATVESSPLD